MRSGRSTHAGTNQKTIEEVTKNIHGSKIGKLHGMWHNRPVVESNQLKTVFGHD